jgi:uncharacterized protein YdhG (YjbR/CyaY superfamily)
MVFFGWEASGLLIARTIYDEEGGFGYVWAEEEVMPKIKFKSVDQYIGTFPADVQAVLKTVRAAIRKAVPDAEEIISYNIPAYKIPGGNVIFFAGWKKHYSLYPASDRILADLGDEVARYEVNKGTIRFPLSEPVPVKLISRYARLREKEMRKRLTRA